MFYVLSPDGYISSRLLSVREPGSGMLTGSSDKRFGRIIILLPVASRRVVPPYESVVDR